MNSPRGVGVVDDDFVRSSRIYDWFTEDFSGTEESVIEDVIDNADGGLAEFPGVFERGIEYDYDCSLKQLE